MFDPQLIDLPQAWNSILPRNLVPSLDSGKPRMEYADSLRQFNLHSSFASPVRDSDFANCCLSGAFLFHNFLDESHRLSQDIETTTGSFWHGIMHRREGDFGNAKYWFRRVGKHSTFSPIGEVAHELAKAAPSSSTSQTILKWQNWEPVQFVDLCERALRSSHQNSGNGSSGKMHNSAPDFDLVTRIAQAEWWILFQYSLEQAT